MASLAQSPVWRNLVARTVVYYLLAGVIGFVFREYLSPAWGALGGETLRDVVGGAPDLLAGEQGPPPGGMAAAVAMITALATALPCAWVYTLTRRKKGFQQSVVQTYLILPVVAAGIVVLVKHSLALAFSLGGIVAAVRFRSNLDDSKDAAGIFVVIGIGMAAAVAPSVAWVISIGFNMLMLGLWYTDFGRPVALEGKAAGKRLERALATANRTGTFIARMDDEVLKSLSPEQLEALADRAWRRRKRNSPDSSEEDGETVGPSNFEALLRIHTHDVDHAREVCEPRFDSLFEQWKFFGAVRENDGRVLEYGITMAESVTRGVVKDDLESIEDPPFSNVEFRS